MTTLEFRRLRTVMGLAVILAGPALAQTATPTVPAPTPTPTATCTPRSQPAPCAGSKKLNLAWFAKDPFTLRLAVSATGCPSVPSCADAVDGELVSAPPPRVEVTDAAGLALAKTITDPGFNSGGCPGGSDVYRGLSRLKLVFGSGGQTTVIGKMRLAQAQSGLPSLSPPIVITIRDACGVLYTATVNTCYPRVTATSASVKCF